MLYGDVNHRSFHMHSDRTHHRSFSASLHCHLVMATLAIPIKIRNDLRTRKIMLENMVFESWCWVEDELRWEPFLIGYYDKGEKHHLH